MSQRKPPERLSPETFVEFWPIYLREHSQPATRWWHFGGTTTALMLIIWAFTTDQATAALLAPILGYGGAWLGHLLVEKNRPATFTWPLWSLMGDLKMFGLMVLGRLWRENLKPQPQDSP